MSGSSTQPPNLEFLKNYYLEKQKYEEERRKIQTAQIQKLDGILHGFKELFEKEKVPQTKKENEPRFTEMKFDLENLQNIPQNVDEVRKKQILKSRANQTNVFCADMTREIITKGFIWFEEHKMTEKKFRQFFCNNFLSNVIKFAHQNKLSEDQLKQLDQHLKKKVFLFMKHRYPQSQEKSANRKFDSLITPVDNLESNQHDLVFKSKIKFEYKESGDYSQQIMLFVNYIMKLTREEEEKEKMSLFKCFEKEMESIFNKVLNQEWMVCARKNQFQIADKRESTIQQIENLIFQYATDTQIGSKKSLKKEEPDQNALGDLDLKGKTSLNEVVPNNQKKNLTEQANKQKYKKLVKQYTKYAINQKIDDNVSLFTDKQIRDGNLSINNPGIMRILAKWCEQLEKCFEEININSREERFRMADGTERYIKKIQRKQLFQQIQAQDKLREEYIKNVKDNIYENQYKMLMDAKCFTEFRDFATEDEGISGYFATVMKKSYENYLVSYLNKLIHCILSAQESFKSKYSKKEAYKIAVNLISFKVGDLLRCKCSSKQAEIIALYGYLKYYCNLNPEKLELVRVKNRLSEGNKDILINFTFHKKLLVQMQLSINEQVSDFIKCSDKANHFIYELQRATFGPMTEICSVYGNVDPRAEFFRKKFDEINDSVQYKPRNKQDICDHSFTKTTLPVWCSQCSKFCSSLNLITPHQKCENENCKFVECYACVVKNMQINQLNSTKKNISYQELTKNKTSSIIKKKIELLNLQKKGTKKNLKDQKRTQIYFVYFNFKIMLFELSEKGITYLDKMKDEKQFNKFFINKAITNIYDVSEGQQKKIQPLIQEEIVKLTLKEIKKKSGKYFVLEEVKIKQQVFKDQNMQSVEQINMNNIGLQSISNVMSCFPNVKVALLHKNKIGKLDGISKWNKIKELNLEGNQKIYQLPQQVEKLHFLQFFLLTKNNFDHIPNQLCNIPNLKTLNFKENKIQSINPNINKLKKLTNLRLTTNSISQIPSQIQGLVNLIQIDLGHNNISIIPQQLRNLEKLEEIKFQHNHIKEIPDDLFDKMTNLKKIEFSVNQISKIPTSLQNKKQLTGIDFRTNHLKQIPHFIFELPKLHELQLSDNKIEKLHINMQNKKKFKVKYINLMKNELKQIPEEFFEITSIQKLKIGGNNIGTPSNNIKNLVNLKQLGMEDMQLTKIPSFLFEFEHLSRVSFDNNQISSIPADIQKLKQLKELYLSKNNFFDIPQQIFALKKLQNLGLNKNHITNIPENIKILQKLQKLKLQQNTIRTIPDSLLGLKLLKQLHLSVENLQQGESQRIKGINKKLKICQEEKDKKDKKKK